MAGPADTAIGYGRGWATVSNTPFREYKHWTHEGGISTPLIVHWPAQLQRQGELEATPGHLVDLMATAVDVAGAKYPKTYHDGQTIKPMEGVSLAPLFAGKPIQREAIYWEHEGNRAVRRGDYKLVAKGAKGAWELYNIAKDRSEQHDLSAEMPELALELSKLWDAYAERANVLPLNPKGNAKGSASFNRKQRRFRLAGSAKLDRHQAPFVAKRQILATIDADIQGDGVLVAQGGVTHGWAIYVQQGELKFATTVSGRRSVAATGARPKGAVKIEAHLDAAAKLSVRVDDQTVFEGKQATGLLQEQPLDGIEVGEDRNGEVGAYATPFPLQGKVNQVDIEVRP